jgi:hypothetical protein
MGSINEPLLDLLDDVIAGKDLAAVEPDVNPGD